MLMAAACMIAGVVRWPWWLPLLVGAAQIAVRIAEGSNVPNFLLYPFACVSAYWIGRGLRWGFDRIPRSTANVR